MTRTDPQDAETPKTVIEKEEESRQSSADAGERIGFLPIQTNAFDRGFIGVVIWIAIALLWFRFLEPLGLSIWIANAISLAIAVFIIRKG